MDAPAGAGRPQSAGPAALARRLFPPPRWLRFAGVKNVFPRPFPRRPLPGRGQRGRQGPVLFTFQRTSRPRRRGTCGGRTAPATHHYTESSYFINTKTWRVAAPSTRRVQAPATFEVTGSPSAPRPSPISFPAVASRPPQPVAAWLSAPEIQETGRTVNTPLRSHDGRRIREQRPPPGEVGRLLSLIDRVDRDATESLVRECRRDTTKLKTRSDPWPRVTPGRV